MKRSVWIPVVASALVIAGCGGGGSEPSSTTAADGSETSEAEATTTEASSSPEDALREAATAHWAAYQAMDVDALYSSQTERCQGVNTVDDFEAAFANVDEDRLAALDITITDVVVDGDQGTVTVQALEPSGEAAGTDEKSDQAWVLVDGTWQQDDC